MSSVNQTLEKAGRVDDFFQLGMLMCRDALERGRAAAATSAPSTRPRRARRCATTRTSPTSRRGSGPATRWRPTATRRSWCTRPSTSRPGATSEDAPVTTVKNLTLKIWRQDGPDAAGRFETYRVDEISEEASFLELLDVLNERLIAEGKEAIVFDHDCREGICGTCSLMIDGQAHGPQRGTATCQLHMRKFTDGDEIVVEPWRAKAFPIIKDLMVDRSAFDRIVEVGGFITAPTGGAPDANLIPVPKPVADAAMDAAECIGCGACVAACPNGAANLFTAAKIAHLNLLPQGQAERLARTEAMVETMEEYFGSCTNHGECEAACPKSISIDVIALMNADYLAVHRRRRGHPSMGRAVVVLLVVFAGLPLLPRPVGGRVSTRLGSGCSLSSRWEWAVLDDLSDVHRLDSFPLGGMS